MRNPVQIAQDIFCSTIARCIRADDESYLLELQRLVDLVKRNSQLRRCLEELRLEVQHWQEDFTAKEGELRTKSIKLRNILVKVAPGLAEEAAGDPIQATLNPTIADFDKRMADELAPSIPPSIPMDPALSIDERLRRRGWEALSLIIQRQYGSCEESPEEIRTALTELEQYIDWLYRERLNFCRSHAGAVWNSIIETVKKINPSPEPVSHGYNWDLWLPEVLQMPFDRMLYGSKSRYRGRVPTTEEGKRYKAWKAQMNAGLNRLCSEVEIRLATRASSEWALRRYAARSGIYKYAALRDSIKRHTAERDAQQKTRDLEAFLVDDAAAYLFDLGFPVLTERHLAGGRLDIYEEALEAEATSDALLVEAKIYSSASTGKKAVYSGLAQLYGYATSIESSFHPTENFLLLYRLDGPKLVLPREDIPIGDYYFRMVHIDLAPPATSGSRSPKPVTIDITGIVDRILEQNTAQ